mmetsp:Transcript_69007/g.101093  ORF Transcript_69007/g.101093 Transcript_69007/m.101093 type:complete len:90 (+) Transcript_69007:81-350(+)
MLWQIRCGTDVGANQLLQCFGKSVVVMICHDILASKIVCVFCRASRVANEDALLWGGGRGWGGHCPMPTAGGEIPGTVSMNENKVSRRL